MQSLVSPHDTEADCPRKLVVEQQKIDHLVRLNATVGFAIHLERTRRAQHCRPLDVIEGSTDVHHCREQNEVLHIQNTRGLVCPLQHPSELNEVPGFTMSHCGVGDSGEQMAGLLDVCKEIMQFFNR